MMAYKDEYEVAPFNAAGFRTIFQPASRPGSQSNHLVIPFLTAPPMEADGQERPSS